MAKFFIGLVTGVVLVFLSFVLLFFALLRFREKPPQIADNSVLVLRLHGEIPEKPPVELPDFLGGGKGGATIPGVWQNLKKAAADSHIRAVVLQPEGISAGWAKLEEIRADLEQFRKSGKPVYAYLRTPGTREYYLALGADRIYLGPQRPAHAQRTSRRADVLQEDAGQDRRQRGGGARRQVQGLRRHVHPHGHEPGDARGHQQRGRRALRQHRRAHRRRAQEVAGAGAGDHRPGSVHRIAGAESGAGGRAAFRRPDVGRTEGPAEFGRTREAVAREVREGRRTPSGRNKIALVVGEGDIIRGDPNDNGVGREQPHVVRLQQAAQAAWRTTPP